MVTQRIVIGGKEYWISNGVVMTTVEKKEAKENENPKASK